MTTKFPVCSVADELELPHNFGSLFWIADALGVETLFLTGSSPRPPNRKLRKTSRGTEQAVAFEHHPQALPLVLQLKAAGRAILSLEIAPGSVDIRAALRVDDAR